MYVKKTRDRHCRRGGDLKSVCIIKGKGILTVHVGGSGGINVACRRGEI